MKSTFCQIKNRQPTTRILPFSPHSIGRRRCPYFSNSALSPSHLGPPQRQSESWRNRLSLTNSSERSIFDFGRCGGGAAAPSHHLLLFRARRRLPFDISNDRERGRERERERGTGKRINIRFLRRRVRENLRDQPSFPPSLTRSLSYSLLLTKSNQECVGFPLSPQKTIAVFVLWESE